MPSPFPGMDPYLERRSLWPDFHASFLTYIREYIQPRIRPKYNARIEERVHLVFPPHDYYPDLTIIRRTMREATPTTMTATLTADEPVVIRGLGSEYREPYIEIVYLASGDVVTTIELLSPINKSGDGRQRYVQKQEQLLQTQTSLVEIDLLRGGQHTVAVPEYQVRPIPNWRYLVCVKRPGRNEFEIYFTPLQSRLPRCRIPLREPDPDVVLDLPAVFQRTYDISGFEDLIDYRQPPPPPPLSEDETAWLTNLLHASSVP